MDLSFSAAALAGVLALSAFGLAAWLSYRFGRPGSRLYVLDHPNDRSLHEQPTPRSGGVAILAALYVTGAIALAWWSEAVGTALWLAAAAAAVALLSFVDDRKGLPPALRLLGHFAAASLLLAGWQVSGASLLPVGLPVPGVLLTVAAAVGLVWMLNLYNFMDGMDGLAGGMAVAGFGSFAVLGWLGGDVPFAVLNLLIAAAALGFLIQNLPPARIFMGDVGASTLGFLAGGMGLWAHRAGLFPWWIAAVVFSPFIVDATVTLLRRLAHRERVWEAHRTHYYQRLVQCGWGHRKTMWWAYGLMLVVCAAGVGASRLPAGAQLGVIALVLAGYAAVIGRIAAIAPLASKR